MVVLPGAAGGELTADVQAAAALQLALILCVALDMLLDLSELPLPLP